MISQETIKLYVYVDGINDVPFYGDVSGVYEEFILANGEVFTTSNGFAFNVRHTNEQIEIGAFRYDAKRMGGAPTITFTLMYEDCLDNFWSDKVYAVFNGEKYFLRQTPTSSLSNDDARYKHEVELISERVALDNIYFFDTVEGNANESDKAVSNSTKVTFSGSVHEFAKRLNASLEYTKLLKWEDGVDENGEPIKVANGYNVVVDEGIGSEEKLMTFTDQFISNVLQEIYKTYEVPYYFDGKTIHIGFSDDVYPKTFSYGVDNALLSITKNNANYKVVNRVTGKGSTENIPYYYPNNSPKGEIEAEVNTTSDDLEVNISDIVSYSDKVKTDEAISYIEDYTPAFTGDTLASVSSFNFTAVGSRGAKRECKFETKNNYLVSNLKLRLTFAVKVNYSYWDSVQQEAFPPKVEGRVVITINGEDVYNGGYNLTHKWSQKPYALGYWTSDGLFTFEYTCDAAYTSNFYMTVTYTDSSPIGPGPNARNCTGDVYVVGQFFRDDSSEFYWSFKDKKVDPKDFGLNVLGTPKVGDTITQRLVKNVTNSKDLMPSVYRHSDAKERFYNAINYPYPWYEGFNETLEEDYYFGEDGIKRNALGEYEVDGMIHNDAYKEANGKYIKFKNPYSEASPKEHIISVEDLKPTIKDAVNSMGLRMDMFSEFAYDLDDNDETEETDNENSRDYIHSYFFGKLRKLDFNLFECAIEQQPMTISFTSGACGSCNFEIGVTEEYPQKNPVQVDGNGNLVRNPETGNVVCGQFEEVTEFQDSQQDTSKGEVWIALKKEEDTYGILMPKAPINGFGEHRPKACTVNEDGEANNDGDTFVILGIHLPDEYIHRAEDKLRDEIIKYIKENNEEKFSFSISFSRIFFAENPEVLQYLNENSRINIEYNGKIYTLYVTSYSYNMGEGDVLPEIKVELDDTLTLSQNSLQRAISEVKSEVGMAFANYDVLAQASPYFLRKDSDDICNGKIDFKKGIKFGKGGKVEMLDNNSAKLTIEYLEVTKKASFTSLEIKEKTHVGGQIIISPAAMTCGEVEELEDVYRCYFQTQDENGEEEIYNQFVEDDLAICQTYNAWGSRYYWRKVVGIGEDYIDLSKTLCDENSDTPMAGDKIVQLGNTSDMSRQAAQVLSAYGEDAPSFIMYNGIDDFTLVDKNITGIIWNPKTLEPQMYSYGSFFFGDGTTDESGNLIGKNYITYQQRDGDSEKKLHINATVNFSSDSTGLSNLEEWKDVQTEIKGIVKTVENVQDQIDGEVQNHFYNGTPTTLNFPAVEWTTDIQKINHIGDTYTDIEEFVDSETTPNAGKSWRWCRCDDTPVKTETLSGSNFPTDWHKLGTIDTSINYFEIDGYVKDIHIGTFDMSFDEDILIVGGPPTYIKIESATGDVYIKDAYGYFSSNVLTLVFKGTDYVEVTDKDGVTYKLHWHPIADTDAIKALLKTYELEKRVSDADYLKDTFKKGSTELAGGVVMSQMVAVRNNKEKIEAFLNGSDEKDFIDNEHGKLIIASGIPEDGENLKERAKEAKTKLYEDGHFETTDGKMELMQVNSMRGMVSQVNGAMIFDDGNAWYIDEFNKYNGKKNSPDDIILGGRNNGPKQKTLTANFPLDWGGNAPDLTWDSTQIGRRRTFISHKMSSGYVGDWCAIYTPDYSERPNDTSGLYPPYFYVDGTPRKYLYIYPNDCIQLYGYGYHTKEDRSKGVFMGWIVTGRTPIFGGISQYHLSGMQEGLRPKARVIKETGSESDPHELSDLDHTIIISEWSDQRVYLKLPDAPQEGQVYEIFCVNLNTPIDIDTSGKQMYILNNGAQQQGDSFGGGARRYIKLLYADNYWFEAHWFWS